MCEVGVGASHTASRGLASEPPMTRLLSRHYISKPTLRVQHDQLHISESVLQTGHCPWNTLGPLPRFRNDVVLRNLSADTSPACSVSSRFLPLSSHSCHSSYPVCTGWRACSKLRITGPFGGELQCVHCCTGFSFRTCAILFILRGDKAVTLDLPELVGVPPICRYL